MQVRNLKKTIHVLIHCSTLVDDHGVLYCKCTVIKATEINVIQFVSTEKDCKMGKESQDEFLPLAVSIFHLNHLLAALPIGPIVHFCGIE